MLDDGQSAAALSHKYARATESGKYRAEQYQVLLDIRADLDSTSGLSASPVRPALLCLSALPSVGLSWHRLSRYVGGKPVAKFSEEFYEKFGHGLADELVGHLNQIDLTFRSELALLKL